MRTLVFFLILSVSQAGVKVPILGPKSFETVWEIRLESAYQALSSQDYISARQKLIDLLETPARPAALYYLAQTSLHLEQIERAYDYLGSLRKERGFLQAYRHSKASYNIALGQYFLRRRKWQRAFSLFETSLNENPSQDLRDYISEIYLHRVRFMRRGKDLRRKLKLLKDSHKLNAFHEKTLSEISTLLLNDNHYNKAETYLAQLVDRFPSRKNRFLLAVVYTYTNKIHKSLQILARLKIEFPEDPEILEKHLQIRKYLSLSSDEEVPRITTNLPEPEAPENSEELDFKEKMSELERFYSSREWIKARSLLQNMRKKEAGDWRWVRETVHYYQLQGKHQQALDYLEAHSLQFGDVFEFKLEYAKILEKLNHPKAETYLAKQIEANAYSADKIDRLREFLGKTYLKSGNLETAREIFEGLQQADGPRKHVALFFLGVYYGQIKYFQKSLEYYQSAHEISPRNPKYLLAIATTFRQLGLEQKARHYHNRLAHEFPNSKYTRYASQVFQTRDAPPPQVTLEQDKEKESSPPYFRTFRYLSSKKPDLEIETVLGLMEATHQWDNMIQTLETYLKDHPNRPSLEERLESLYKAYPHLDFGFELRLTEYGDEVKRLWDKGQVRELESFYTKLPPTVQIQPELKMEMARAFLDDKRHDFADKLLGELVENSDQKIEVYSLQGYSFFMQKNYDRALSSYYQALSLDPSNVALLFKLAELLKTTGELQKSRLIYEEIIKLKVDEKSVQDARFYFRQLEKPGQSTSTTAKKG